MKFPKIGMRVIKTMVALFLSIAIYVLLMIINNLLGLDPKDLRSPLMMYTPFYAGIAAVYTLHKGRKSSLTLAKSRSLGSLVGGYFGVVVVLLSDLILIKWLDLKENNEMIYRLIFYAIVSIAVVPLIQFIVYTNHTSSVFITCLTFLSVTISSRNNGLPVFYFANNRILSTMVGIGISLFVNNFSLVFRKNKNILFVSSLDNNLLTTKTVTISQYIKYKLNNLYFKEMPLTFATTRTLSSLEYIFNNVDIEFPVVVMNGAAIYYFKEKKYDDVYTINPDARLFIDEKIKELDMNAFTYSIEDNILHAYYTKLKNEAEIKFYQTNRQNDFDNFVRATLPLDANASLYIIIDHKERIDNLANKLKESNYSKMFDLVIYPFKELDGDYYYLKINSNESKKEILTLKLKEEGKYEKLIVCGSGYTDLELIRKANFSICLSTAPDYIKDEVDLVINDNPENILKVFEKIYHSRNFDKTIEKLTKKYKK